MKRTPLICTVLLVALLIGSFGASSQVQATRLQATAAPTQSVTADPLGGATSFAKLDKEITVNLMLDWTPNTNHLGFYVAKEKGFYQEANLKVEIQQPGDIQVEQIVATGKAQFGVSYQEQVTYVRAEKTPIVSVAAIVQHNTSGFAAENSKHALKTPADLNGLRYGAFGSQVEKPILDILTQCAGGSADKIEFIDIGFADPLPLMDKNRIDFVWLFYAWDGMRAKRQNMNLDFIMLKDYAECVPDYYTPLLITSEDMIKNQPDTVRAFVQATARGYAYAIQHPDEAAEILIKAAPDLDADLVRESSKWLADQFQADAPRWGEQSEAVWQRFTDFLVKNNALTETIDVKIAFTNEFLPTK